MGLEFEAKKLVGHIKRLKFSGEFQIKEKGLPSDGPAGEHIGSIIVDATLQAHHKYKIQVMPRVENLRSRYSQAATTSGFLELMNSVDLEELLMRWEKNSTKKLKQIQVRKTAQFFADHDIETFSDLATWIKQESNRRELKKEVYGISDKTADYYGVLTGDPDAVAIDVRISIFLSNAGIDTNSYKEKRTIVQLAARQMGYRPLDLEQSIWDYNPKRKQKGEKMDKNNKDLILGVHLPPQEMEQLEAIAREQYGGEEPENLAKSWIIERLHQLGGSHEYPVPLSRDTGSQKPAADINEKAGTGRELRREMVCETVKSKFSDRPFSGKELFEAMDKNYGHLNRGSFIFADWTVNEKSGYEFDKEGNYCWRKKCPILFKREDGLFERYDPLHHGNYTRVDDKIEKLS